ncbi:VOC family protein [Actinocrispum wychmicini]|uniref:Putative enzyme related to lactoylglutathione lyase n=1 Tax=Actinocrispum wychmicini TaxID=1213861 RepID=A0A4R2JAV1_9PSEU|nr:VOC family protein [Actinocrispum wychmicini]TCO55002.1 putative enzyme related to lactoylglutathione lyase [Actinocrispum wychmicini]
MLRGMCTISLFADDLAEAKRWYTELLGVAPYFERDGGYIEFRIGDRQDELGIVDGKYRPHPAGLGGVVTYWAVDDVNAAMERLLEMGAKEHDPIRERGEGFVTASVVDPFGNILGVMYNAHYLEMLP